MRLRPSKWLKYAPVALLPLLAAYAINSGRVLNDLQRRAHAGLVGIDAGWAKLSLDGRDALISGDSPSLEAIDSAVTAVSKVDGIRRVQSAARIVPQPAEPSQGESQ